MTTGFAFIFFLTVVTRSSFAHAQMIPFGSLSGDPLMTTFQLEGLGPSVSTEQPNESVAQFRSEFFIPVAQSEVDAYAIQIRGSRLTLDKDRTASGAGAAIPKDLGSVSVGPFMRRKFESGDMLTAEVQLGRAGTELGRASTATTLSANIFWGRPKDEAGGQWVYLLSYSNSRSTLANFPIPGFAFAKTFKTESAQGLWAAGAPFFFSMIRSQPWFATIFISPFTAFIEGGYSIVGPFAIFTRFGWQPQAFKVNGGPSEKFLYEEFRSTIGVKGPVARWAIATLGFSFSDGRRVAWGDSWTKSSYYESRLQDEVSLFWSIGGRF